ncbi:hypothetical protein HC762_00360 [bacterium]|nr:hypothetical protein [bacterium]
MRLVNTRAAVDARHRGRRGEGAARPRFEGLRREVQAFFLDGKEPPEGLLIVNLNLRAIAAGGSRSLMERQLLALLKPEIWAPCESCSFKSRCPLKANADTYAI